MGGTGIASPDSISLPTYGTSKWRAIDQTRATISFRYSRINADLQNESHTTATGRFGNLDLAIPLKLHKIVLGISVLPYADTDLNYSLPVESNLTNYQEFVTNQGNIGKARLSLIWSPMSKLGFSFEASYYFGVITDKYQLSFTNVNYFDSDHEIEYRFRGPGLGFSIDINPIERLALAGFVDSKPSLKIEKKFTSPVSNSSSIIAETASFPIHFGIGANLRFHKKMTLAVDYSSQQWSNGISGVSSSNSESNTITGTSNLDDWYHVGIGLEREARRKRGTKFLSRLEYRLGVSSTGIGYKFNNSTVIQYAAHLGFGIPYSALNRFDFAFVVGIRGDKSKHGAEEKFFGIEISLSMGEQWFQKLR